MNKTDAESLSQSLKIRDVVVDEKTRQLIVGQTQKELEETVLEHGEWIHNNAIEQTNYYARYFYFHFSS